MQQSDCRCAVSVAKDAGREGGPWGPWYGCTRPLRPATPHGTQAELAPPRCSQAVVFVVDAAQHDTLPRCRDMLHQALSHADLAGLPLLVLSNKMDLPEALLPAEVAAALQLTAIRDRAIHIAGCSALQNNGVKVRRAWRWRWCLDSCNSCDQLPYRRGMAAVVCD